MFDFIGLFHRSHQDVPMAFTAADPEPQPALPLDHVVLKDGRPFAILNATPALASRTLAGFVRSTPGVRWTLARC